MTYIEKLRDPRWQKKRLEIMSRDEFTCQECDDKTTTLNVHHRYYQKGAMPWEYPDNALVTYCEQCHGMIERRIAVINKLIHGTQFMQERYSRFLAADRMIGVYSDIVFSWTMDAFEEFLKCYEEAVQDTADLEQKRFYHLDKLKILSFEIIKGLDGIVHEAENVLTYNLTIQQEGYPIKEKEREKEREKHNPKPKAKGKARK